MKRIVLWLELHDDKAKQKALRTVSAISGIDSIGIDMKEKKLTVIGTVDPVRLTMRLRRNWPTTSIILVGPAQEPEKKEEAKKEEGAVKKDGANKEDEKKYPPPPQHDPLHEMVKAHRAYNPPMTTYYYVQSIEENPNDVCAIC